MEGNVFPWKGEEWDVFQVRLDIREQKYYHITVKARDVRAQLISYYFCFVVKDTWIEEVNDS